MKLRPTDIFEEYRKGTEFKSSLGGKGLFEQSKINERFYIGDQWKGAKCGNERPLVRHNVIKRIGDYKISQILNNKTDIAFSAEGVPAADNDTEYTATKNGALTRDEITSVMRSMSDYYNVTAERLNMESLNAKILRDAYINGTSVLYTYWDSTVDTGLFADEARTAKIKGDICCEVLKISDVVFGDPYVENVEEQPYIIISSRRDVASVIKEARLFGADLSTLQNIEDSATDGKITVLTRLYKVFDKQGLCQVYGIKVTENEVVRREFSTGLRMYPLAVFRWDNLDGCAYGESEITYLIPNQIAINRMITANVWSAMTTGMPIMLVNGDTVSERVTNDPGQIIRIYGSNDDVERAVKYVSPTSFIKDFDESINNLINNTLTQSGANEVALGDSKAENATALRTMRDAALMPLQIIRNRYYVFLEDTARIWADFWVTHYGKRKIKNRKEGKTVYAVFDGDRYRKIIISARLDVNRSAEYSEKEKLDTLITLFEKGIITKKQLLVRMPEGMISDLAGILSEENEVDADEGA